MSGLCLLAAQPHPGVTGCDVECIIIIFLESGENNLMATTPCYFLKGASPAYHIHCISVIFFFVSFAH